MVCCNGCGTEGMDGDCYCRQCGEEMPATQVLSCECGEEVLPNDNFCHSCGSSFSGEIEDSAEAVKTYGDDSDEEDGDHHDDEDTEEENAGKVGSSKDPEEPSFDQPAF
ncbi:MAG: hypothetical protein V1729_00255 [Candidatus Woesearchaeota archaeon]